MSDKENPEFDDEFADDVSEDNQPEDFSDFFDDDDATESSIEDSGGADFLQDRDTISQEEFSPFAASESDAVNTDENSVADEFSMPDGDDDQYAFEQLSGSIEEHQTEGSTPEADEVPDALTDDEFQVSEQGSSVDETQRYSASMEEAALSGDDEPQELYEEVEDIEYFDDGEVSQLDSSVEETQRYSASMEEAALSGDDEPQELYEEVEDIEYGDDGEVNQLDSSVEETQRYSASMEEAALSGDDEPQELNEEVEDVEYGDDGEVSQLDSSVEETQQYSASMEEAALSGDDEPQDLEWEEAQQNQSTQDPSIEEALSGDSNFAPTVLSGSSAEDEDQSYYYESFGRRSSIENDLSDELPDGDDGYRTLEGDASDKNKSSVSDWRVGESTSALFVRERPVNGGEPFSNVEGADYEMLSLLASGGMGDVFIARQNSLKRTLAIKTLKPPSKDEKAQQKSGKLSAKTRHDRQTFLTEAVITANLVHPNIVPIHDLGRTTDGMPFYSMKKVEGSPWVKPKPSGAKIKRPKDLATDPIRTMSLSDNLEVLLKICDAVAYAHDQGVVNRDLKPENVIIGEYGEVIVLDWGLAFEPGKTKFVAFPAGTPAYMAPELWHGPAEKIGNASDIYLLGGILFEILTGLPPHKFEWPKDAPKKPSRKQEFQIRHKMIGDALAANVIRKTKNTGELLNIALRALATEPEDRYESATEFKDAIKNFQRHEESRHLARRASQLMKGKTAAKTESYEDYQAATALYDEAVRGWKENERAKRGLSESKLKYAELAYNRNDYDLGLQLVNGNQAPEYLAVRKKLEKAKKNRSVQKWGSVALLTTLLVAGPTAAVVFKSQAEKLNTANADLTKKDEEKSLLLGDLNKAKATIATADTEAKRITDEANLKVEQAQKDADNKIMIANVKAAEIKADADRKVMEADAKVREADVNVMDAEKKVEVANATAAEIKADADKKVLEASEEADRVRTAANVDVAKAQILTISTQADSLVQTDNFDTAAQDYERAVGAIDELLEEVRLLPEDHPQRLKTESELATRRTELKAQAAELLRLATPTQTPVQTQRVNSDGTMLAWLHAGTPCTISLRQVPDPDNSVAEQPFQNKVLQIEADGEQFVDAEFIPDQKAIVYATKTSLSIWNYDTGDRVVVTNGNGSFTAIEVTLQSIFAATEDGFIKAWNHNGSEQWKEAYPTETEVRDLRMIPGTDILLCAGSRANTSADVLALKATTTSVKRLDREHQLRYTLDTVAPPKIIAVSPKGGELMVVANSRNGGLLILPRKSGSEGFPFLGPVDLSDRDASLWNRSEHGRPINAIAFSDDGTRFATASDDRTVGIWKVEGSGTNNLKVLWENDLQLRGHGAAVTDVAFVGGTNFRLQTTSRDRYSRSWDLTTYAEERKELLTMTSQKMPVTRVNPKVPSPKPANSPHANPDSRADLSFPDPRYKLTKLPLSEAPYRVLNQPADGGSGRVLRGGIRSVDISRDGSVVAVGGVDGTAALWDSRSGDLVRGASRAEKFRDRSELFEEGHKFNVSKLLFLSPQEDQNICVSASFDGSLCLWQADLDSPAGGAAAERNRITDLRLINAVAGSADGSFLVSSAYEQETTDRSKNFPCRRWDVQELLRGGAPNANSVTFNGFHKDIVTAVSVSPNGKQLATGAKDGFVALWNAASGELLSSVRAHDKKTLVTDLVWADDNTLISAGVDGAIRQWTVTTDAGNTSLNASFEYLGSKRSAIDQIALSTDRTRFLTVSASFVRGSKQPVFEAKAWQVGVAKGVPIRLAVAESEPNPTADSLTPYSAGTISSVAWSGDGQLAAVVAGGQINLLDTATWTVKRVLRHGGQNVTAAVFPERLSKKVGEQLLATFDGVNIHLWGLSSRELRTSFHPQQAVNVSTLSPDAEHKYLVIGSRSIRVYNSDENDAAYGQTVCKLLQPHTGDVTALAFNDDVTLLASGGSAGQLKLWRWNAEDRKLTELVKQDLQNGTLRDLKWQGSQLLAVAEDASSLLTVPVDLQPDSGPLAFVALQPTEEAEAGLDLQCGDIRQDGSAIVIAGRSRDTGGSVGLLFKNSDGRGFQHQATFSGHGAGGITCTEFIDLAGSPYLVSGGNDGAALLWNWSAETPYPAYRFLRPNLKGAAHSASVTDVAVSNLGGIVTGSDDGTAIVWDNPLLETPAAVPPAVN